jgi:hypothetical protein
MQLEEQTPQFIETIEEEAAARPVQPRYNKKALDMFKRMDVSNSNLSNFCPLVQQRHQRPLEQHFRECPEKFS